MQSENINELATALAIAQGKITGALKESANPFFKSKYADLASVWDACREALSDNGLCVIQTTEGVSSAPISTEEKIITAITVVTTLAHKSGQWVRGELTMIPKDASPQAAGSCLTYARRYALAAIVGVAQVDDDANAASQPKHNGDRSGRPDTSKVDPDQAGEYAQRMWEIMQAKDKTRAQKLQFELNQDDALYQETLDIYRGICKANNFKYGGEEWRKLSRMETTS